MILDIVTKFVRKEEILFITSNLNTDKNKSSDIDIYCVTTGKSFVEFFYNAESQWVELFVDNISDVNKKIYNIDEIAINFIRELHFYFGNKDKYLELFEKTSLVIQEYNLPPYRKNLLKYRIKVLLSKYINEDTKSVNQDNLIINAMSYPLIQLVLEHHNIFPSSPKYWISQLQNNLPPDEFKVISRFLSHQCSKEEVVILCEKYAGNLDPIHIEKEGCNDITFLS